MRNELRGIKLKKQEQDYKVNSSKSQRVKHIDEKVFELSRIVHGTKCYITDYKFEKNRKTDRSYYIEKD